MKLSEAREAYYEFSKTLSEITRKLGFAGIAVIWLFRGEPPGKTLIPPELWRPLILIVLALSLDFLQYVWATLAWGIYSRHKEREGLAKEIVFHAPAWINWPTLTLFWSKVTGMALAYLSLMHHLFDLMS